MVSRRFLGNPISRKIEIAAISVIFLLLAGFTLSNPTLDTTEFLERTMYGETGSEDLRAEVTFENYTCDASWGDNCYNYSYDPENEDLKISLVRTSQRSGGLMFENGFYDPILVLETSSSRKRTNIWAESSVGQAAAMHVLTDGNRNLNSILPFIGNQGVDSLPLRNGDSVTIKKDFTDKDGDGIQGVENNETFTLYKEVNERTAVAEPIAHFSVTDNTARMYKTNTFSSLDDRSYRWIPCDLENQVRCMGGDIYRFNETREINKNLRLLNMFATPILQESPLQKFFYR